MSDGRISIAIEVDGKQVKVASSELDKLGQSARGSETPLKGTEKALDGVEGKSKKAGTSIKDLAVSFGLVKVGAAAFNAVAQSMDAAISRVDTLNKFPKVLQSLGVDADASERAISRLSQGIDGLPTTLNDIAANAQRMYTSFNDIDTAADSALALNNAMLGSGSSAADAQRGTEQYLQVLQRGKFEMEEWKTLQETMDVGLIKIAEGFGFVGATAKTDLYNALADSKISMMDFNDMLIEVGTGTGVMAELARVNSLGFATSISNLKNAAARGLADIISALNDLSLEVTGSEIPVHIDNMKVVVNAAFKVMSGAIRGVAPYVIAFKDGVKATIPVVDALSPVIMGLVGAYVALQVINKVNATVTASRAVFESMAVTTAKITALTNAKTAAEIANNGVQAKYLAANLASMKALTAKNVIVGLLTGSLSLSTAATLLKAKAVGVLSGALKLLSGPVGWVIVGIGLLVAAGTALYRWFNKASAEGAKMTKETKELASSMDDLSSRVDESSKSYDQNQKRVKTSTEANQALIDKIEKLSKVEDKSAKEKKELAAYVDQLNGSVEGLNLTYSKEHDMLSQSSQYLRERVDLMREQEIANNALERTNEIIEEQAEIEMKLAETNELRADWNLKLEEGSVKAKEHKEAINQLDEQEQLLKETTRALAEEQKTTEEQFSSSMQIIADATESAVQSQIISLADLSEAQQQTVEDMRSSWASYKEAATDMFNTLSEEADLTVADMQANLEENQRIIGAWAENIASLAERGIDEGLLETLREAGPQSAGYVNELVNASDEELQRLSDTFANGGDVAADALAKSLGIENNEVVESVSHLVTQAELTMKQEIERADFGSIGKNVSAGLGEGISEESKVAIEAAEKMADDTIDGTKKAFRIHSPSRVFKDIGTDVTGGLALGVNEGTAKVLQAAADMFSQLIADSVAGAEQLIRSYDSLPSSMYMIGSNAMAGLRNGLDAGRSAVMGTARSIAYEVASTMQSALRIHSPSRVMKDDVGRWIPEGVAEGIEGNAGSVYSAVNRLASGIIKGGTPEMALGLNGMTAMSAGQTIVNRTNNYSSGGSSVSTGKVERLLEIIASKDPNTYLDGEVISEKTYKKTSQLIQQDNQWQAREGGVW